jgi:hypothetical protein
MPAGSEHACPAACGSDVRSIVRPRGVQHAQYIVVPASSLLLTRPALERGPPPLNPFTACSTAYRVQRSTKAQRARVPGGAVHWLQRPVVQHATRDVAAGDSASLRLSHRRDAPHADVAAAHGCLRREHAEYARCDAERHSTPIRLTYALRHSLARAASLGAMVRSRLRCAAARSILVRPPRRSAADRCCRLGSCSGISLTAVETPMAPIVGRIPAAAARSVFSAKTRS